MVLLIILIIVGLLCYTTRVNKDLSGKINKTSFQEGGTGIEGDDDNKNDELLE